MATYRTSHSIITNGDQSWYPPNVSDVPTAVHTLLASTRRLQEILKLWSADRASESQVSDVYVQIVHDFNTTVTAFANYDIELSDVHSIPDDLRVVLEGCLSEDPSPRAMETFLPELRKVLYKLLKGLQARKDLWLAVQRAGPIRTHLTDLA